MLFVVDFMSAGGLTEISDVMDATGLTHEEVLSCKNVISLSEEDFDMWIAPQVEPSDEDVDLHWLQEAEWADL